MPPKSVPSPSDHADAGAQGSGRGDRVTVRGRLPECGPQAHALCLGGLGFHILPQDANRLRVQTSRPASAHGWKTAAEAGPGGLAAVPQGEAIISRRREGEETPGPRRPLAQIDYFIPNSISNTL